MKLKDFTKQSVRANMPLGRHEITFLGIDYRVDDKGEVTGAFIRNKEYRNLYINIFDDVNVQLDLLCEQLGVESYDPEEINKCAGTKVIATSYAREQYTNISFNPKERNEEDVIEIL